MHPYALLFCLLASAHAAIFLASDIPRVAGYAGLAEGPTADSFLVSNGVYAEIGTFDMGSNAYTPLFTITDGSYPDDVVSYDTAQGRIISTSNFLSGKITTRFPNGTTFDSIPPPYSPCAACGDYDVSATPYQGINPIAYSNGNLYFGSAFVASSIFSVPWQGGPVTAIPLSIALPGINAFDFCPDGKLYAPSSGRIVQIDVSTGTVVVLASGITTPIAVECDPSGDLFVASRSTGNVYKFSAGVLSLLATLDPPLDNMVRLTNWLIVSNGDNALYRVDPTTGESTTLTSSDIKNPGLLDWYQNHLYIADMSSLKIADRHGEIETNLIAGTSGIPDGQISGVSVNTNSIVLVDSSVGTVIVLTHALTVVAVFPFALIGTEVVSVIAVGDYYLANDAANGRILQLFSNGTVVTWFDGLITPVQLRTKDGYLYVTDAGNVNLGMANGRLLRISLATRILTVIRSGLNNPQGFDFYHNSVILAEVGSSSLVRIFSWGGYLVLRSNLEVDAPILISSFNPVGLGRVVGVAVRKQRAYVNQRAVNNIRSIRI